MLLCCRDKYHSSTLVALLIIHYPMPTAHIIGHSGIVPAQCLTGIYIWHLWNNPASTMTLCLE
ncbi:Uncharacterised protein [Serratia grimesii]|nr:Uncharacterised protein [Serratia grimesii]CAI2792559.1 Uncharacterised protein [Serratia grimesii]CUW03062.1 Uncharacterised protein [Serratia grimesii]SMZ55111.1 Uncharacterised protein [Serratia grimesii]